MSDQPTLDPIERTLVLVKPDGVARPSGRGAAPDRGQGLLAGRRRAAHGARDLLEQHYAEHVGKPFYEPLVEFMSSGPVVAAVDRGPAVHRGLPGAGRRHRPDRGAPRHDPRRPRPRLGHCRAAELVHGSDSPESAAREIGIWFPGL